MPDLKQDPIKRFYDDVEMRVEMRKYFEAHLDNLALEKVYNKEDTHGIADARDALDKAYKQMEETFEPKPKKKKVINEAR